MKQQLIYVVGFLVCMFFAYRVMKKVKDVPMEDEIIEPVEKPEKEENLEEGEDIK